MAASGTVFAQATLSGKLGFSYQKNAVAAGGAANHGMQMADGDINFAVTEDLGGGTKITAKSAFVLRGRDTAIAGRDASLTIDAGGALYTLGNIEKCSRIDNVAGAPISLATGQDGGSFTPLAVGTFTLDDSCHNVDTAGMVAPIGPITFATSFNEVVGGAGNAGAISYISMSGDYSSGPFSVGLEYRLANASAGAVGQAYHNGLNTGRLTASYDMGVAVVGAGFQTANHDSPNQYTLSASVPLGAATVGLAYSNRAAVSAGAYFAAAQEGLSATAVGVDYKLSKMTTVNTSYGTYSNTAVNGNEYRIRLMKAF